MDLDELRTVQAKERRKDSLQHLRDSFYADVATYIADLRAERDRRADRVDDPFSDDGVRRLSDEIETAEEVAEAIYERRVGKVVKLASFAAADMAVQEEGMTEDERRLFEDLVGRIEQNKATVLDALSGVTGPGKLGGDLEEDVAPPETDAERATRTEPGSESTVESDSENAGEQGGDLLAGAMGGDGPDGAGEVPQEDGHESPDAKRAGTEEGSEDEPSDPGEEDSSALRTDGASGAAPPPADPQDGSDAGHAVRPDRTTVRITDDVGSILGVDDREYDLEREDVVSLPETNAGPLLERGAAERLD